MLLESMILSTRAEATQWAYFLGMNEENIERLAEWIWDNKPYIGCSYRAHPIYSMDYGELHLTIGAEYWYFRP